MSVISEKTDILINPESKSQQDIINSNPTQPIEQAGLRIFDVMVSLFDMT